MKSIVGKCWKWGLSLLFGIGAFLFWALPYYSAMSFQEQMQMFLWNSSYFCERVSVPGGLADWLGEFLVQFYFAPLIGAAIIALLYVLLQRLTWMVMKAGVRAIPSHGTEQGAMDRWYALSFLIPVMLWGYMGDENVLMSLPVAMIFCLLACWCYTTIRKGWIYRWAYPLLMVLVLYWTMGSVVWGFALFVVLWQFVSKYEGRWVTAIVTILWTLFIVIGSSLFLPYPLFRLVGGLNYYRFGALITVMQMVLIVSLALVPILTIVLARRWKLSKVVAVLLYVVVAVVGVLLVKVNFDEKKYEVIDYDFMVRTEKWHEIIAKAEKKAPTTPTSVACLNLALQQTGRLGDRMFEFYQNGTKGLIPEFQRESTTPLATSEVFYRMGFVNDAMRYNFEAQEAIPNYRKSARMTKRMAECNLINGEYAVARKYLNQLRQTLFYGAWAERTLELMKDENAINSHRLYGHLRRVQVDNDFLFSESEMDQMIGMLLVKDKSNKMAFEYLIAYVLLNRDINHFNQYYSLGRFVNFDHIPRHYLEASLLLWSQHQKENPNPPAGTDQLTMQRFQDFGNTYNNSGGDATALAKFKNTYWYYMLAK